MKTFLKVLLMAALLVIAIKFSPIIFIAALVGMVAAALLGVIGLTLIIVLLSVLLAIAVALSPIWVPILAVIGLISLFRRQAPAPTPVPPVMAA
jgi:hypothetical protein